jgi:hypothetical protein
MVKPPSTVTTLPPWRMRSGSSCAGAPATDAHERRRTAAPSGTGAHRRDREQIIDRGHGRERYAGEE